MEYVVVAGGWSDVLVVAYVPSCIGHIGYATICVEFLLLLLEVLRLSFGCYDVVAICVEVVVA